VAEPEDATYMGLAPVSPGVRANPSTCGVLTSVGT